MFDIVRSKMAVCKCGFLFFQQNCHQFLATFFEKSAQIPYQHTGFTIGAYIVFPNNRIDGNHTINQAHGVNSLIDDRFDLTLECIRLFYLGQKNPLYATLLRHKKFFDLFDDFIGYIHFFLLDDLIVEDNKIKFYLPFDGFKTRPTFSDISQYILYKKGVINFIKSRNKRIENYIKLKKTIQGNMGDVLQNINRHFSDVAVA